MKQRPMVLIFAGVLSGTAVVWNIMSMTAAFYLLTGICLLASLIFSDRRYGWVVVGILTGILLSLGFKTSMKLDLIQVKEKATEYTMGRVLEVSKTKKGKLAVLLKNKNLEGKILLYTPEDEKIIPGDILRFQGELEEWKIQLTLANFQADIIISVKEFTIMYIRKILRSKDIKIYIFRKRSCNVEST